MLSHTFDEDLCPCDALARLLFDEAALHTSFVLYTVPIIGYEVSQDLASILSTLRESVGRYAGGNAVAMRFPHRAPVAEGHEGCLN